MATRKRLSGLAKKSGKSSSSGKETKSISLHKDMMKELQARLSSGKNGVVEVLALTDEAVLGRVRGIIPSGSVAIDKATSLGGWPRGRIVEVYGPEHGGKTTLLLQAMASTQKLGGICGLYDAETKLDIKYAQALGVNTDDVILFQPEEGGSKIEHGVRALRETLDVYNAKTEDVPDDKKPPLLFGWDSLAASGTHVEEARSQEPGVPAREVRSAMRELTTRIARAGANVIILNQVYARIGIPGNVSYGGGGLKFASSIRVDMRRTGRLELPNGAIVGVEGQLSIEKNSLGNFAKTAYAIAYLKGFVDAWTIFEKLQEAKYIQGAGGWQTFAAEGHAPRKWQGGWARLSQMMVEEPPFAELLRSIYLSLP
jgi:recombination protein RecA